MKRVFILIAVTVAAVALFGGLTHVVLMVANLDQPAATTVYGWTTQRFWATLCAGLALVAVLINVAGLARRAGRFGTGTGRRGAIVAMALGLVGVIGGWLLLAGANGGPGSGNGVVGSAGALVLGLIAMALSAFVLTRPTHALPLEVPGAQ
jgi:hypothetical protein